MVGAVDLVFFSTAEGLKALRSGASRTLVELGVSVTELDGDVSKFLIVMSYGVNS